MTATYSRPSRNITNSMRAASPGSRGYPRPALIGASPWDQALVGEQVPHLVERGVGAGQDELRRTDVVVGHRLADRPDLADQIGEGGVELRLVALLDRGDEHVVELVQLEERVVGHLELALTQDAQDHLDSSPAEPISLGAGAPAPSSAFILASSASTDDPADRASSWAWMSPPGEAVTSSRAPEARSSSTAPARAWSVAVLSSARWMARPTSPISSEMPDTASPILAVASAAVYVALIVSFLVRNASTLVWRRWRATVSLSSSAWSCWRWASRPSSCCCTPARRLSASRAR